MHNWNLFCNCHLQLSLCHFGLPCIFQKVRLSWQSDVSLLHSNHVDMILLLWLLLDNNHPRSMRKRCRQKYSFFSTNSCAANHNTLKSFSRHLGCECVQASKSLNLEKSLNCTIYKIIIFLKIYFDGVAVSLKEYKMCICFISKLHFK